MALYKHTPWNLKHALSKKQPWISLFFLWSAAFFFGCSSKLGQQESKLTSIQLIDRHGFRETISSSDRLVLFQKVDFLRSQSYEKVTRVYHRNLEGKTPSKITTYHENGQPWQYLEVMNGRACGTYREWHPNGQLRLDVMVIEGIGDLGEEAQRSWVFDELNRVWDEYGHLIAEIHYERGILQGNAFYYHPNGKISKIAPYEKGMLHGIVMQYNTKGEILGKSEYREGKRHGLATFQGDAKSPAFSERYDGGLLLEGVYCDLSGKVFAQIEEGRGYKALFSEGRLISLQQFCGGQPQGEVQCFDERENLTSSYHIKDGLKHGEEWFYYSSLEKGVLQPKLYINWYNDEMQGICRSWYLDGTLESEREMVGNQKSGLCSAWYQDGSLMLVEEYENNFLKKGKYWKKGNPSPVSIVEEGDGLVTLYDAEGNFIKKIPYQKGKPTNEP